MKVLASVRNKTHLLPDGSYNNLVSVEEFSGFTTIEATDTQGNRLDVAIKE